MKAFNVWRSAFGVRRGRDALPRDPASNIQTGHYQTGHYQTGQLAADPILEFSASWTSYAGIARERVPTAPTAPPNAELRTPNAELRRRTPNAER